MSERLNSVDIEDVLSSIRRLVSEDARPAAKAASAAAAPPAAEPAEAAPPAEPAEEPAVPAFTSMRRDRAAPQPPVSAEPQADKLILTPSLRIVPEPAPEVEEPTAEVVEEAPMLEDATEEEMASSAADTAPVEPFRAAARVDAVMDQVAQELDRVEQDWEPVSEPPRAFASDWAEEVAPAVTEDVAEIVDPLADPAPVDAPSEDLADPVETVAWEHSNWATPDWQEPAPVPEPLTEAEASDEGRDVWSAADGDGIFAEEQSASMAEESAMTKTDDPADLPEWARMEAETMAEEAAFMAAATATATASAASSAGARPAPSAADEARWADAAEAQIRRELEDAVEPSAFAEFDEDDHDDRRFDEEMLRDLVRDIIREELQGALGERITRNVRKLVRAEIARAMAVRDFE